jgi:YD repeat-containing protein
MMGMKLTISLVAACLTCWSQSTTFRYFYDGNHQLIRVIDSANNSVEYEYDLAGNTTKIIRSTISPGAMAIFNIVPSVAAAGQDIAIYGQNFDSVASGDTVKIDGVAATVVSATSTTLVVRVPQSASGGAVTVTVNGVTASSGAITFTPEPVPTIASITPAFGYPGQTLSGVIVQGTNLTGASFSSDGAIVQSTTINSATQATLNLLLGPDPGYYALIAQTTAGASNASITANNAIYVYFPAGENVSFQQISVFNAYVPPGVDPLVPTGSNQITGGPLSVFNAYVPAGVDPLVPTGSNQVTASLLSVFNGYYPPGINPLAPIGSNQAFELLSYNNTCTTNCPAASPTLRLHTPFSVSFAPARASRGAARIPAIPNNTLIAGQTIPIEVTPGKPFTKFLEFDVNGVPLASSDKGVLRTLFTVPYGVGLLSFLSAGHGDNAARSASEAQQFTVAADPGRVISGHVSDPFGNPVSGAAVVWHAAGLTADYYAVNQDLDTIPNLDARQPSRTAYVSALNFPNPEQVFGRDPMGAQAGKSFAARFHGKIIADSDGQYEFLLHAHAAARLSIDGREVVETAPATGAFNEASASAALTAGAHEIEVLYYESDGASTLQLFWTRPGAPIEIVPPSALVTDSRSAATAVSKSDGSFRLSVPAFLDGVQLKLAAGEGNITPDADGVQ